MASQIFIIPRRNDLEGMGVQLTDLWPNTSQKNGIYDGAGQTHYVGSGVAAPGATKVNGNDFVSGSLNTLLTAANAPAASDTTGGGADSWATTVARFGLAAYLQERVQKATTGSFLTTANAIAAASAIEAAADAGASLTLASINVLLAAVDAGTGLATGTSFGSVTDILRILSGEIYRSPRYTILTDVGPTFLNQASRAALVDAQLSSTTGKVFVGEGAFLTSLDHGFQGRPVLARTGIVAASNGAGQIHGFKSAHVILNPAFTYGAAGNAYTLAGVNIPASGSAPVLRVYDSTGIAW